ncbi:MAG: heavy metal translocating P-type ATPase [Lautropia sp.]|nr:heavy metal translocating P-type ATPase [Lautropia sp.]
MVSEGSCCCGHGCAGAAPASDGEATAPDGAFRFYRIANMDCASEEAEIRHALADMVGVHALKFRLAERVLGIAADEAVLPQALDAIRRNGFRPEALAVAAGRPSAGAAGPADGAAHMPPMSFWQRWGKLLLALGFALSAEVVALIGGHGLVATAVGMLLAAVAIGLSGLSVYVKGWAALRQGRLNINALMSVAVTGAFLIGQWPEAAMVMSLYALAEAIEARAVDRARNAIQALMALAPDEAEVWQPEEKRWLRVAAADVMVDARVRVRPGERIPLDGEIVRGQSALDQSAITGESLPVDKGPGDEVFAGTINQTGELEICVTARAANSTLARIIHAVEEAQASRAPTQRFVDRFAAVYTPLVFVLAMMVAVLLPLLGDSGWIQALYKALVLLVIACPCALVISTPVTVVSGLAAAARRGILIKGGAFLEQAREVRALALDKTGTLTTGRPVLVAVENLADDRDESQLRQLAHSLAVRSDHPVSRAIAEGLADGSALEVTDFEAVAGRGTQGRVGERRVALANHRWVEERGQCSAGLEALLATHQAAGRTVTLLVDDEGVLALLAVADTMRPDTPAAVAALKAQGITPVMLTGDNEATAQTVAAQAGIAVVRANLLPEEKLQAIAGLQETHGVTAMVGDGINDAPALARADIGFAMGAAGTHTAMEAADVLIMNDDLQRVSETVALSRRTHAVLWQNIVLALGIKAVFLVLAVSGNASMWMAVFADMGASLLVVFNGLRLLRQRFDR